MTTSQLDSVIQVLKEKESKLIETISQLEETIAEHQSDLARIQGAIAALEQKPKIQRKKRKAPSKPSASKADVESAMMSVKDDNPNATDDQLRTAAEEKLIKQGFSKSGLALRFKQVLSPTSGTEGAEVASTVPK